MYKLRFNGFKYTCKRMQNRPTIEGFHQCNGIKQEKAECFKCVFVVFCVFEALQCDLMSNYSFNVGLYTKINHKHRSSKVFLNNSQTRADLFLK